jgi:hypothetical protein
MLTTDVDMPVFSSQASDQRRPSPRIHPTDHTSSPVKREPAHRSVTPRCTNAWRVGLVLCTTTRIGRTGSLCTSRNLNATVTWRPIRARQNSPGPRGVGPCHRVKLNNLSPATIADGRWDRRPNPFAADFPGSLSQQRGRGASMKSAAPRLQGALIGCGFVSRFHVEGWAKVSQARLAALCDLDRQRLEQAAAKLPGARLYTAAAALFESEQGLDFVEICRDLHPARVASRAR